ncbi:Deoxyguanosinetriphosphate triphosphohydrolase-like protein [bacterium HR15]|uniref:DNTP triphosphohydrolase n=1 Tax=uncultured prokaryote TaxID=198431 RepID=H5S9J8_9ZZZZ|nr:dNTP triphosphohydrolase [uncultured prokaryote]GBC92003.1 Deoxyguanosinetriphosphate triphosphohydrolase-like protein [bacterium HR15]
MTIRERLEQLERETLAPYAAKSSQSRGRPVPEPPDPVRTAFQRDRDRIIHCKAFRRLKHKTQVFLDPEEDHYRTRLTHTLEVAQIARTISRALRLNEDLTEAIALAHDLGHPPFGHTGEEALDAIVRHYVPHGGFRHYEQSLRVVDVLEKDGQGLNLTHEVREGIVGHSKGRADLSQAESEKTTTLEATVVRIADRIAYLNHDLDDGMRAGLLTSDDLPRDLIEFLGHTHSQRIARMVMDVVEQSDGKPIVQLSPAMLEAMNRMKEFMFERLYHHPRVLAEREKMRTIISQLFEYYMEHPDALPTNFRPREPSTEAHAQSVCDYIAGMTDRYAIQRYIQLFLPRNWGG